MKRLKILLTNDDGWSTIQIQTLKSALREAGHNVILVAPLSNQSWGGTTLQASAKRTKLVSRGTDEYSLECADVIFRNGDPWPASPVQCYLVGEELLKDVDVVISGMNIGQNTEGSPLFSGTVGAIYAAISRVIGNASTPGIAVSLGTFADEKRVKKGAKFVVKLLKYLSNNNCNRKLLPVGIGLNVNIPGGLPNGKQIKIKGVSMNRSGGVYNILGLGDDYFRVVSQEGDIFTTDCVYRQPIKDIPYSDNSSLNKGMITIVPIVADTTANQNDMKEVCGILKDLTTQDCFCKDLRVLKYSVATELNY